MDGADFLCVKRFKNFKAASEGLVKWVLQFQNLTKGKGEFCKNGKVMRKRQVSIKRPFLFSYIKS